MGLSATQTAHKPHLPARLLRDGRGVSSLEFALVALAFLGLFCGILDTGWMLLTGSAVQNALLTAARQISTGTIQNQAATQNLNQNQQLAAFNQAVCASGSSVLITCSNIHVSAYQVGTFGAVAGLNPPVDSSGNPDTNFDPGGPSQIVAVRIAYRYQSIMPSALAALYGAGPSNWMQYMLVAQNQPFAVSSP